jgi:EpsD family peptidyl-prolyl cis-trans isomerase
MVGLNRGILLVPVALLTVAACHRAPAAPTGQVVATVGGQEITMREVQSELGGVSFADAKARQEGEKAALNAVVVRKLLAKAAADQGLDKSPEFAMVKQRTLDGLLVQALEAKIASQVPVPAREEAEAYVAAHPNSFSERKVFTVDEIRIATSPDAKVMADLQHLNTLDEIAVVLTHDNIAFRREVSSMDALKVDARLIDKIAALPPKAVFVAPQGNQVLIGTVLGSRTEPVLGEAAISQALAMLKQNHVQDAVARQMNELMSKAAKSVQYNKDFQPAATSPSGSKKST